MNYKILKKLRKVISVSLLLLITFLFLYPEYLFTQTLIDIVGSFQIIPVSLKLLTGISLVVIGLVVVLILTILWGRIYCSTLCPLGTFQDFFIWLSRKLKIQKKHNYSKPKNILRYSILIGGIALFIFGNIFIISLLDPFSNYGRMIDIILYPIIILINNAVSSVFILFNQYYVAKISLVNYNYYAFIIFFALVGLLIYYSMKKGRIFCNTLCPVGGFLSVLSRYSIFKIIIDESTCRGCGVCELKCKARCIKSEDQTIDFESCVGCFNCLAVCPDASLKYEYRYINKLGKNNYNEDRREFIKDINKTLFLGLPLFLDSTSGKKYQEEYFKSKEVPVSPPGSKSIKYFSEHCTACHLCVMACPTKVLKPSIIDYGLEGIFQPKMEYDKSFCNYECKLCGDVCPTGAILPKRLDEKKLIQIGKAVFIKEDCIVETKHTDCGACSEHCPTKAVYMVPYKNLFLPELNNDICIGCGACQKACPTVPRKAIFIKSNIEHLLAKKPKQKKLEKGFDSSQEFPF